MPKRTSRNQPQQKYQAKVAQGGPGEQSGRSAPSSPGGQSRPSGQSEDPQSEFSVPQKWADNDGAPATGTDDGSASEGAGGSPIEGSESADPR